MRESSLRTASSPTAARLPLRDRRLHRDSVLTRHSSVNSSQFTHRNCTAPPPGKDSPLPGARHVVSGIPPMQTRCRRPAVSFAMQLGIECGFWRYRQGQVLQRTVKNDEKL